MLRDIYSLVRIFYLFTLFNYSVGMNMNRTEVFRRQQEDILRLVDRISTKLDEGPLSAQIDEILFLLAALQDKIAIHLVGEDEVLYPSLVKGPADELCVLARELRQELSDLAQQIATFASRWEDRDLVLCQPHRFVREAGGVFAVLDHCIQREHQRLYPLMDLAQPA